MEKKLSNNLGLKILSVFLAFFVWLAVVNISNPKVPASQEVPLEVLNDTILESSGKTYELLNDRNTVTISYKVRTLDKANIKPTDFRAYIDLADMYEPTGAVPVKVEVKNSSVESAVAKPGVIRVETEDLQRKQFTIEVRREGKPEAGYKEGIPTASPTYVYVSGPVSLVGRISSVGIVVKVEGAYSDLSGTEKVQCFDANGNVIPISDKLTFSRSEIDYSWPILKVKDLSLNFETEGSVAEGYRFTGIESSISSVEVKGLKSILAEVSSINIPKSELNLDGATSDRESVIDLNQYLPEGVELADSKANELRVVLKVEALESRTFEMPVNQIKQTGTSIQYDYKYDKEVLNLVIRGLKEDLDQLNVDNIQAELNVSQMEPGIHEGEIAFTLGDAYELMSSTSLFVTVTEKGPSAAQETAGDNEAEGQTDEGFGPARETSPARESSSPAKETSGTKAQTVS